jgi:putative addiction module CopG family antidote
MIWTADQKARIDALIATGRYENELDVIEAALEALLDVEAGRVAKLERLKAAIQEGVDSGLAREMDDEEFEALLARARSEMVPRDAAE